MKVVETSVAKQPFVSGRVGPEEILSDLCMYSIIHSRKCSTSDYPL